MKSIILVCFGTVLLTGCISKKEVVYREEPVVRTTVVREPVVIREPAAAEVRVYDSEVRHYRTPMHPRKLGEYHQSWYY